MARMQSKSRSLENITKDRRELNKKILEARKEILRIKVSTNFQLNGEDQKGYESLIDLSKEMEKGIGHLVKLPKDEKDYAIKQIKSSIFYNQMVLTSLICEEKGHKESVISLGNNGAYVKCKRCGISYTRNMDFSESKEYNESMNTHMTI